MWTLTDLFFPPRCAICDGLLKVTEQGICMSCEKDLHRITEPYCMKCGKEIHRDEDLYCADCINHARSFESGRALFLYNDAMRGSIYRFKYAGRKEYAAYYGREMASFLGSWIRSVNPDALIPVPVHKKRLKKRGFNQAELIANALSQHIHVPVEADLLRRVVDTKKQKELNALERENNLKKAFKTARNDVELDTVLLIDDIYTTGATMNAAATALKEAGVRQVYVMSLCIGRNT